MDNRLKKLKNLVLKGSLAAISLAFTACSTITEKNDDSYSFIMFGDTRNEVNIPYTEKDSDKIKALLADRYHGKDIKMEFADSGKLSKVYLSKNGQPVEELIYNGDELPEEMYRMVNNKKRRVYCRQGQDWVYENIAEELNDNDAEFAIHGGDIVLNGAQGKSFKASPYWQFFDHEFFSKIPAEKVYPVVGNHETWDDENITGMLQAFPYLKKYGFSDLNRIYTKDHGNSRFIYLYSGEYASTTVWNSKEPDFDTQMKYLKDKMDDAVAKKIPNVFVTYHFPSYVQVGHDPLPADQSPHKVLKNYADKVNIVVFSSHTHTTERYLVDGVNYMVMGAGGAPQKFTKTTNPSKEKELYWNGKPRFEEYNYLKVFVDGDKVTGKIHRFIPPSKEQWETVFSITN